MTQWTIQQFAHFTCICRSIASSTSPAFLFLYERFPCNDALCERSFTTQTGTGPIHYLRVAPANEI